MILCADWIDVDSCHTSRLNEAECRDQDADGDGGRDQGTATPARRIVSPAMLDAITTARLPHQALFFMAIKMITMTTRMPIRIRNALM